MKIILFAIVLTLAVLANAEPKMTMKQAANKVILLNNAVKKMQFAEAVTEDLKKNDNKNCLEKLMPLIKETIAKYVTKIIDGQPIFEKDGKEFKLIPFIKNSPVYKQMTSTECITAFAGAVMKALGYAALMFLQGLIG